jgi:hypothetical protein
MLLKDDELMLGGEKVTSKGTLPVANDDGNTRDIFTDEVVN